MRIQKLLCLSGIALLTLTGCGKEITLDEAKKVADENYVTSAVQAKVHVSSKVGELTGLFKSFESIYKNLDEEKETSILPFKSSDFTAFSGYKIILDGKKLSFKQEISGNQLTSYLKDEMGMSTLPEGLKISGKVYGCLEINEKGYPIRNDELIDMNLTIEVGGEELRNLFKIESHTTYKYL